MKTKQNFRDLIYVSRSDSENKCFYSYGIEFNEFMASLDNRPENLILLKHNFNNAARNLHSSFDYVTSHAIEELIEDDVYGYGDFCWVDFDNVEELEKLTKLQIAELLFFGHLAKPLHEIPKVRFAYFAHDDGWFNKLYVTNIKDYEIILSETLVLKLKNMTKKSIPKIPSDLSKILLESTKEGLFIDLSKIRYTKEDLQIPITAVGHYRDMDKVYELKDEIKEYRIWLVYAKDSWKLQQNVNNNGGVNIIRRENISDPM